MNKNVQIEVFTGADGESEYLVLPENTSLTIKRSSNLFGRGDIFSYNFRVVAAANRHIIKNAATAHGELLRDLLQDVPANLYVYGAMYSSGYLKVGNKDFDEDGEIDLSFYGGRKSFDKMIANKNANDIPLLSQVQVGWAHDRTCKVSGELKFHRLYNREEDLFYRNDYLSAVFSDMETVRYPKFVVVKGDLARTVENNQPQDVTHADYTNTYHAYDDTQPTKYPYCNIPVAYTRYVRTKKSSDKNEYEDEKKREYHISDAGRINSAPNFFVMYWLRCLFKSLDIDIVENQLADVEDFTRLFFVNTSLRYDEDVKTPTMEWSDYREDEFSSIVRKANYNTMFGAGMWCGAVIEKDNCKLESTYIDKFAAQGFQFFRYDYGEKVDIVNVNLNLNNTFYPAYATSKNFPEESVDSVLEVLEKAFGVRFVFAEDMKSVRIVLLSKILTQNRSNQVRINVTDVAYKQPDIEGVRWKYGGGSGVQYNYPPFDKILYPRAKPEETGYTIYNRWSFDKTYPTIVEEVSDTNATCYVDPKTGNAYRIAVNKDTLVDGSLIEVGAYEAAVEGNVDTDDDYIKEETIDFTPLQMNRIDGQYALYVGDDMKSSFYDPDRPDGDKWYTNKTQGYGQMRVVGNVTLKADVVVPWTDRDYTIPEGMKVIVSAGFAACYPDNFDYDGEKNSPIEDVVDGLTLCLLRGPADSVASFTETPCPEHDDAAAVSGWSVVGGTGINAHPDSCTEEGTLFDYNGALLGLKDVEELDSLSQRLARAERVCEGWIDSSWAPKLAAATPRFMKGYYPPNYTDEQAASVSSPYDGCASIMYCTADAYVVFHYYEGDNLHEEVRRILFTPLRASGESMNYATYKSACNIIRGFFAAAETQVAAGSSFATTMEAALALMAADTDHPSYAAISGQVIPIWDVNEESIATFAAKWRKVMYDDEAPAQDKAGRFSLKLRAEKPNPFYDPNSADPEKRKQYLEIVNNDDVKRRGLVDVLLSQYKEYLLYGRTATFSGVMPYEDFLAIDELALNEVGGCTGLIKNMQATLGGEAVSVKIELLYL